MDIFCKIIKGEIPSLVACETEDLIVIMDANPDSPGHSLVIPKKHYTDILEMDDEIISKVHKIAQDMIKKMEEKLPNINGVRMVVNYGNLQFVKHFHLHLIPSYSSAPKLSQEEICKILKD